MKIQVIKKLNTIYKDKFNTENILLTGTHTHSAPAGIKYFKLKKIKVFVYILFLSFLLLNFTLI